MRSLTTSEDLKKLYEKDFYLWIQENLHLLREKRYDQIDWEHLIEEIEDIGISLIRSLRSYLSVVLEHLYKLDYLLVFSEGGWGWEDSIINAHKQIADLIYDNPSLLRKIEELLPQAWSRARTDIEVFINRLERRGEITSKEKERLLMAIPEEIPYSFKDLADRIYEISGIRENVFAEYLKRYGGSSSIY